MQSHTPKTRNRRSSPSPDVASPSIDPEMAPRLEPGRSLRSAYPMPAPSNRPWMFDVIDRSELWAELRETLHYARQGVFIPAEERQRFVDVEAALEYSLRDEAAASLGLFLSTLETENLAHVRIAAAAWEKLPAWEQTAVSALLHGIPDPIETYAPADAVARA